ncbi:MAG TPA: hypothetical protein PLT08_18365 [Anaerolineales bacterium]|nr:hypothetical protein [Anaerolineales bacterium]
MDQSNSKPSKIWNTVTQLATFLGLIASIAAVISVIVQVKSESRLLEIQIVSADQLTSLPNVDGLKGEFSYKDVSVSDLWRLKLQIVNSGDVTLIGEGQTSSLLHGSIPIQFPSGVVILDVSEKVGEFYVINQKTPDQIEITFSQWRPKEALETVIYITSDTVLKSAPTPTISGRPIIDGNIIVLEPSSQGNLGQQPFLDKLPSPLPITARILGVIFTVVVFCLIFYSTIISFPIQYAKASAWKNKNNAVFVNHLYKLGLKPDEIKTYTDKPWRFKYMNTIQKMKIDLEFPDFPTFETFWEVLMWFIAGILLCIICVGVVAGLIIV